MKMNNVFITPYSILSKSSISISDATGWERLRRNNSHPLSAPSVLINWGCSTHTHEHNPNVAWVNPPSSVRVASSKLKTYQYLLGGHVPTVEYTSSPDIAEEWLEDRCVVYCRNLDGSSGGRGISVVDGENYAHGAAPLPNSLFYTKGVQGFLRELRVHVIGGRVVRVSQKKKRSGVYACPNIRNHKNGWVFTIKDIPGTDAIEQTSLSAVKALGLDFGAVDIVECESGPVVLEVNTAPGLQGSTIDQYAKGLIRLITGNKEQDNV
jgi:glutathione synthase/RimK-type ligase-like ATP-grasp enzyme